MFKHVGNLVLIIIFSFTFSGCMKDKGIPLTQIYAEKKTPELTTQIFKFDFPQIIKEAEKYGKTPEIKFGNALFIAHKFVLLEYGILQDRLKIAVSEEQIRKIHLDTYNDLEEIKKALNSVTVPSGSEGTKEVFINFIDDSQKTMKFLSENTDKNLTSDEIGKKYSQGLSQKGICIKILEYGGYSPTEDFLKYYDEAQNFENCLSNAMLKAENYGNTPEMKFCYKIVVSYMTVLLEFPSLQIDIGKNINNMTKIKEIALLKEKEVDKVKILVNGFTIPPGYENVKNKFIDFADKNLEAIKIISEGPEKENYLKDLQAKGEDIIKSNNELLLSMKEAGYDFQGDANGFLIVGFFAKP